MKRYPYISEFVAVDIVREVALWSACAMNRAAGGNAVGSAVLSAGQRASPPK